MIQIVLVGLGAGAAAALLFASVVSGSLAAVFLFYLAPLPIMIAALGWSHLAGLIAAASATAVVGVLSGVFLIAVPVIAFGAWWLGYLAMLARPATNGGGDVLEWYPVGRLVLWAAVIGTLIVAAAVPNFGVDQESLQAALRKTYERILRDQALIDVLVVAVPPAAAIFSTITSAFNLWLAARVVKISGRLKRPWPDLAALALSPSTSALLAAAIAGSFLPDLAGVLSGVFAASLLMAFAILGFAVLHAITRGMRARIIMLTGLYAAAAVFGWPVLAVALLGLAESILNIRSRVARKRGPPSLRT
ncbi:MAG: hypothetical protein QOD25_2281 [Alphaproteobacteria bacterium]|jgi:hypothetical protein|nr:hypothetical protein [Alphaproteobacteria bacterium]